METPFKNEPMCLVALAFYELFGLEYNAQIVPILEDDEGNEVFGCTTFLEDLTPIIEISANIKYMDMVEVFAHELAHIATKGHEHDEYWDTAFQQINDKYNELGEILMDGD